MTFKKPVEGRVTSPFGVRVHPVTGVTHFHNGVDLSAEVGTAVICPLDGTVVNVWENDRGGLQLKIKHFNGLFTGYAHLSRVEVEIGDEVKQGQRIALTGASGTGTGAHLHFTLRDAKGNLVDPENYFV